jgi:hypothetical protein
VTGGLICVTVLIARVVMTGRADVTSTVDVVVTTIVEGGGCMVDLIVDVVRLVAVSVVPATVVDDVFIGDAVTIRVDCSEVASL